MKKKRTMEPGVKYRGYALLNEYGEIEFIPEDTGSRKGVVKMVCQTDQYKVSTTKNRVLVYLSINKCNGVQLCSKLFRLCTEISVRLRDYEL